MDHLHLSGEVPTGLDRFLILLRQPRDLSMIRSVCIQQCFFDGLTPVVREHVLEAICEMRQLRKFSCILPREMSLPTSWLAKLLHNAPRLCQIEICRAQLTGDFDVLSKALANNKAIQELNFWMLRTEAGAQMDSLMIELSKLKRAVLDWDEVVSESVASISNWEMLLSSSSKLESLVIGQVRLQDGTVGRMARALHDNRSLKELGLCGCQLSNQSGMSLGNMLQHDTRLDRLELCGNTELGDSACDAIAAGLQRNTRLRRLDLSENDGVTRQGYLSLVNALHHHNTSLECMSTDADRDQEEILNFYLRLNRSGRNKKLHQDQGDHEAWIDTLALHCCDNLDHIYYYLSVNPSLCDKSHTE